jgi:hypothetical protein
MNSLVERSDKEDSMLSCIGCPEFFYLIVTSSIASVQV